MKKALALTLAILCVFAITSSAFARAPIYIEGGFAPYGTNYEYWGLARAGTASVSVTVQLQYKSGSNWYNSGGSISRTAYLSAYTSSTAACSSSYEWRVKVTGSSGGQSISSYFYK